MPFGILELINNKNKLYRGFMQPDKNNVALFNTVRLNNNDIVQD